MNCRGFERLVESFLVGGLPPAETEAAGRHVRGCDRCGELLELARIALRPADPQAALPPPGLVAEVLARTAGAGCGAAERQLCDQIDGALAAQRAELVAAHLSRCSECRALAGALAALSDDLPRLAEIRPDGRFVEAVLAQTLPPHVRLRRWWRRQWPRWVARPRFAAEAAYVTTLIVALVVSTPGSPLAAMPGRAAEIARGVAPLEALGNPLPRLEAAVAPKLEALKSGRTTRTVVATWHGAVASGSRALERATGLGGDALGWVVQTTRTLRQWFASVLERAGETPSPAERDSDEESR